jgi:hypothetical protein
MIVGVRNMRHPHRQHLLNVHRTIKQEASREIRSRKTAEILTRKLGAVIRGIDHVATKDYHRGITLTEINMATDAATQESVIGRTVTGDYTRVDRNRDKSLDYHRCEKCHPLTLFLAHELM